MTSRFRQAAAVSAMAGFALVASDARAWSSAGSIEVKVNDHLFDRVRVEGNECQVEARVHFNAPRDAYQSGAKIRNHYLFQARITLKNGKQLTTEVFRSSSPARRVFTHSEDTKGDGCWAKEKSQVIDLDVVGCRGLRCKMPDFD